MRALVLALVVLSCAVTAQAAETCKPGRKAATVVDIGPVLDLQLSDASRLILADVTLAADPLDLTAASALVRAALAQFEGVEIAYRAFGSADALGRRKAQAWAGERWLQGDLVREGLVRVAPSRAGLCTERLLALEAVARREGRGIWATEGVRDAHDPDALRNATGTYQLVAGRVLAVAHLRAGTYVNFGQRWRFDTTVLITPGLAETIGTDVLDALEGRPVLVRGWIEDKDGPLIRMRSALQLRPIDE